MPDKYWTYTVYLVLTIITLAVFWQVRNFDFINYDDDKYVSENHYISSGLTYEGIVWLFTKDVGRWHPLTGFTHMLDCELFGLKPGRHHLVNLFFHIINTLLLFIVLKQMTGALWQSAFVAALFAIHPLHVESVAWISGRKDVLSTMFMILTISAYFSFVRKHSIGWYVLALTMFALGLLAKPMLITLPFLLLLLDYWPLHRFELKSAHRLIWEKMPFFALSIVSTVVTYFVQKSIGAVKENETITLAMRAANAVISYVKYIGKLFVPENLAVFYPYPAAIPLWQSFAAALLLLIITICIIRLAKKFRYLPVGWFWFLGTLVPVIGLLQVGAHAMADRYTYVSLIGLFLIIAWGFADLSNKWKCRKIVLSLSSFTIIAVLAVWAAFQTTYWQNTVTLFEQAVKVTNGNYLAHVNLGAELMEQNKLDKAIDQFHLALQANPKCADAYCNLAGIYRKLGRYSDAIQAYNNAVQVDPSYASGYYELGVTYDQLGQYQRAIEAYELAIKIIPHYAVAYSNLGTAYSNLGRLQEAVDSYTKAVGINPGYADAYNNLGVALGKLRRYPEAIQAFSKAIQLNPDFAEAHLGLGVVYFMSGDKNSAGREYEILKTIDAQKANLLLNLLNQ